MRALWGELTALYFSDVVLRTVRPAVLVNRAWKRNATGEFAKEGVGACYLGAPKPRAGRRTVRIGDELAALLKREIHGLGPGDLVFTATRGGMIDQPHFHEYRWKRAVVLAQKHRTNQDATISRASAYLRSVAELRWPSAAGNSAAGPRPL